MYVPFSSIQIANLCLKWTENAWSTYFSKPKKVCILELLLKKRKEKYPYVLLSKNKKNLNHIRNRKKYII